VRLLNDNCGGFENVLERWCGAVEAGPFVTVEGDSLTKKNH
jgi:hypothetical protein